MSALGAERKCWPGLLPAIRGIPENICSLRAFRRLTDGVEKVGDERSEAHVLELLKVVFSRLATAALGRGWYEPLLGNLNGFAASRLSVAQIHLPSIEIGRALPITIIVIAGWRFVQTAKDIDSDNEVASPGERFDLALSGMLGLLGAALLLYLSHAVLPLI